MATSDRDKICGDTAAASRQGEQSDDELLVSGGSTSEGVEHPTGAKQAAINRELDPPA